MTVDQRAEGLDAFAARFMQAGHVVSGGEQQVRRFLEDGGEVVLRRVAPVAHDHHAQFQGGRRGEGRIGGGIRAAGHAVVIQGILFGDGNLHVMQRGALLPGRALAITGRGAELHD